MWWVVPHVVAVTREAAKLALVESRIPMPMNCKNCGAPREQVCSYCGTSVCVYPPPDWNGIL